MTHPSRPGLASLARPSGRFALLAMDQRETLRTLLLRSGGPATDDDLRAFKVAVARSLSPIASGMLIDRVYGLDAVREADARAQGCGLIVAVDDLIQQPGESLQESRLDDAAMTPALAAGGAVGLKFLCLWRPEDDPGPRNDMVARFVEGCRRLGLVSVLEGLVRLPVGDDAASGAFDEALVAAASEFARHRADLYKTHVPTLGIGTPTQISAVARQVTDAIGSPWVVLSAGVPAERFEDGVEAACRGGASGFLAGQGVWGPSLSAADVPADLAAGAVARFERLVAIVDTHGRPWTSIQGPP